jgi:hypothetical protein
VRRARDVALGRRLSCQQASVPSRERCGIRNLVVIQADRIPRNVMNAKACSLAKSIIHEVGS